MLGACRPLSRDRRKLAMSSLDNSFDIMLSISVFILIIVVWARIVVIRILPRVEMPTRGVYEELKRGVRGEVSNSLAAVI